MPNPYEVLGISTQASQSEIKSAFRRLAKETHPDLNGNNQENISRFQKVVEAYSILSDPNQKKAYDNSLEFFSGSQEFYGSYDYSSSKFTAEEMEFYIRELYRSAQPIKAQAIKKLLIGLAWLIGGLVVTIESYRQAAKNGGTYRLMWGAILFGGIQVAKGIYYYYKISKAVKKAEAEMWDKW